MTSRSGNDIDGYHAHIKQHETAGNGGHDDRQHFATVGDNPGDAKCQRQRKAGRYQQSSKDCKRITSPRPKNNRSNNGDNSYAE